MRTRSLWLVGWVMVSTVLCQGKSKPPLFSSPDFDPAPIKRIDVFVVDQRNDLANDRECMGGVHIGADHSLGRRGYNKDSHAQTRFYNAPIPLPDSTLSNPSKEWLQDLANRKYVDGKKKEIPPPGRWIMVITLDEVGSRDNAIKGLGRASLSMYLYDRDEGTSLWHDQATTEHMWGGVLGNVLQKGLIKADTCKLLASSMVLKLPKHKK